MTSFTERKQEVKSEATQGVRTSLLKTVMALVLKQIITKRLEFYKQQEIERFRYNTGAGQMKRSEVLKLQFATRSFSKLSSLARSGG